MSRSRAGMIFGGGVALMLVLAASGCAAQTDEAGQPTEKPSSISTPDVPAATQASAITALVVRPQEIELRDSSGVTVTSLSYEEDITTVVAALSDAVGTSPTTRRDDGGLETPVSDVYEWTGFTIVDFLPDEGMFTELTNLRIAVTAAQTDGNVHISTQQGFAVGDDFSALPGASALAPDWSQLGVEFGPDLGDRFVADGPPNAWAVVVSSSSPDGLIENMLAPVNLGIDGH